MNGKILRVSEYDLKFGNKEKKVNVFSCFKDLKYNNQYIIYSNDYDNNLLYFGNVHIKNNKLIVMDIKQNRENIINNFIEELVNDKIESYEIIPLNNINSIEIITFNTINYPLSKLLVLDKLTIKKEEIIETASYPKKNKKSLFIFLILLFLIIGGVVFIYFNQKLIFGIEKTYLCTSYYKDKTINAKVTQEKELTFNKANNLNKINTTITYVFEDEITYNRFKKEKKEYNYMPYEKGAYKYIDEELTLKIFADDTTSEYKLARDYSEVVNYYNNKNYYCVKIEEE